ncbi:MAG: sugar phosphate isomerase/epimerase [Lachnospiraceae bacterium]|nr:sugar phosphate isomerase/epimerase [Lachnospiraceae bacterium]
MAIRKSVVLSALLPDAETDDALYEWGLARLAERDVRVAETYIPFDRAAERRRCLEEHGMEHIYLGALYQKRNGIHLCATEEKERQRALAETGLCLDAAAASGSGTILLTSGRLPKKKENLPRALRALKDSLKQICARAAEKNLAVTLEPGDTAVQAFQLIGSTDDALALMEALRESCPNLSLTMDTSHTVQLGEDIEEALRSARPFCRHVHLANCILKKEHPLYGDRHPLFTDPDGEISPAKMQYVTNWLKQQYHDEELTLSFEIICQKGDNRTFMERVLEEEDWFFRY